VIKCGHHLMHLYFIITIAHYGACLLMEFDSVTSSTCFGYDQALQMVGVNAIAISKQ